MHGLIYGRAYYWKDICVWDLGRLFSGRLITFFFFGGGGGGVIIGILRDIKTVSNDWVTVTLTSVLLEHMWESLSPFRLGTRLSKAFCWCRELICAPSLGRGSSSRGNTLAPCPGMDTSLNRFSSVPVVFTFFLSFFLFFFTSCWSYNSKFAADLSIVITFPYLFINIYSSRHWRVWKTSIITKCDECYYKVWQVLQSATILLQSATGITKCDDYYKVRQNSEQRPFL